MNLKSYFRNHPYLATLHTICYIFLALSIQLYFKDIFQNALFIILYPTIFFLVWTAGLRQGFLAICLSFVSSLTLFGFSFHDRAALFRSLTFVFSSVCISLLIDSSVKKEEREKKRVSDSLDKIDDLYNSSPCGLHSTNSEGIILNVNKTELDWLGYLKEELLGENISKIYSAQTVSRLKSLEAQIICNRFLNNIEVELINKDGETIYCILNSTFEMDSEGKIKYSRTSLLNITDKKRQADHFEKISKNAPGLIYIFKKDRVGNWTFPYVSEGVIDILGVPAAIIKHDATLAFKHHLKEEFDHFIKSVEDSEKNLTPWKLEFRVNLPHRGIRWLLGNSIPEKQVDGSVLWFGNIQDITEIKELSVQASLLSSLVLSSDDAIIGFDLNGKIFSWNKKAECIFGENEKEAIGKNISFYIKDFEENFKKRNTNVNAVIKREIDIAKNEKEIMYLEITDSPIFSHNELMGYSKIIRDVSWRKRQEAQIQEKNKMLIYSGRLASLGEMAAGVAHEINNPLTIIASKAKNALKKCKNEEWDQIFLINTFQKIIDTSFRISKIISGLKKFSRQDTNSHMENVWVSEIIDDTLYLCSENLKFNEVIFTLNEFEDLQIECRDNEIVQILGNLILNSIHAVEKSEKRWIDLTVYTINESIYFRLTDSGNGISEDIADKIMEPFFTTKELGKGAGLGLSISHGIAKTHNGDLILDKDSRNTSFVLKLPVKQKQQIAA